MPITRIPGSCVNQTGFAPLAEQSSSVVAGHPSGTSDQQRFSQTPASALSGDTSLRDGGMQKHLRTLHEKNKAVPYIATATVKNKLHEVRLNCVVKGTPDTQSSETQDKQVVECRHFAQAFAAHPGKKINLVKQLGAEQGIEQLFEGRPAQVQISFNQAIRQAPQGCKRLIDGDNFGT
jgi:hypothetical protein